MSLDIKCRDTICAIATPQGYSALGIIRTSGPLALHIWQEIFRHKHHDNKPFKMIYGEIVDIDGHVIDEVMGTYFKGHNSFTGEDSFEIYAHGNPLILHQILGLICSHNARVANPGEFSFRALSHNKIDLAQAESIFDLIHAQSKTAQNIALRALKGGLGHIINPIREDIVLLLAEIEARMDFPEEDLGHYDKTHILAKINHVITRLANILSQAPQALRLYHGARVVICGAPNAGKSTLLNCLSQEERAIVHEEAGTTRDMLEANIILKDIPLTIVDIAGLRSWHQAGEIEKIGINKAIKEIDRADLIIWLADITTKEPFTDPFIKDILSKVNVPIINVLNKVELVPVDNYPLDGALFISAKELINIDKLKDYLYNKLMGEEINMEEMIITKARQRDELLCAQKNLISAEYALTHGYPDEIISLDLRSCGLSLDRLLGLSLSEDVLDTIFSKFCIGK